MRSIGYGRRRRGGGRCETVGGATRIISTPTPIAFALLRRSTLPTRGRVPNHAPMTFEIAVLLVQDAFATGAIYVLMALGIVLIFNVTRVIFVPYGDLVAYSALTLASLEVKHTPGTVWLVLTLAVL